jgi:hypothetical protein
MEKEIFNRVVDHWNILGQGSPVPKDIVLVKVHGKLGKNACVVALVLDAMRREAVAVVKVPRNPSYTRQVEAEAEGLAIAHRSGLSPKVLKHIPSGTVLTRASGQVILLQTACKGHSMVREMTRRDRVEKLYGKILEWMVDFHISGCETIKLVDASLEKWVEAPVRRVKKMFPRVYGELTSRAKDYLSSLGERVRGSEVSITRQHGDFNAHNVLVEMKGSTIANFSLIDWEDYSEREVAIHDLNHFFVSNSKILGGGGCPVSIFCMSLLSPGWYHELYIEAVQQYARRLLMDKNVFLSLTPLYLITMCLRVSEEGRSQGYTAETWARRAEAFIEGFPRLHS